MSKKSIVFCFVIVLLAVGLSHIVFARHLPVVKHTPAAHKEVPQVPFVAAEVETLYGPIYFEDGLPDGWEFIDGKCQYHWHATEHGAYDNHSYWCGIHSDTYSGYYSYWSDWLDSPEITIPGGTGSLTLTILHKLYTEDPTAMYWDGSAVFVRVDGGPWEVVRPTNTTGHPDGDFADYIRVDSLRAWECTDMANTVYERLEGLPGWAGLGDNWLTSTFDLSAYAGASTIEFRYAFVSDWGGDSFDEPDHYGGNWVESFELTADGSVIFFDDAEDPQMTANAPCPGHQMSLSGNNQAMNQKYPGWPEEEQMDWPPVITEPYPPSGWTPGTQSVRCADEMYLNTMVVSPWITLPPQGYPRIACFILADMPGGDWDNDGDVDDYWHWEYESSDELGVWHEFTYSSGGAPTDNDSTWEYWWWDRVTQLKVHDLNGQEFRTRWRLNTDGYQTPADDPNDTEACQRDPCIGNGWFLDEFTVVWLGTPALDLAISEIDIPWIVSVDHPSTVTIELANIGETDIPSAVTFFFLLDPETLEPIPGWEAGVPMGPPYPFVPALDTFWFEYEWIPEEVDTVRFRAQYLMVDEITEDDELFSNRVAIYPSFHGQLGNTIRQVTGGSGGSIQEDTGPAVRFTVPDEFENGICIDAIRPSHMGNHATPIWVYVKGAGPDDTTWGEDLIEPFLVNEPDTLGQRVYLDLTGRPDYENLCGITGDFWIHLRQTAESNFSFTTRGADEDNCLEDHDGRDWLYYLGTMVRKTDCYDILVRINWAPAGCVGIRGDANGDGGIDVLDVLAVVNHILGITPLTGDALCRGDCNGDGGIDVLDALGIVNDILGTGGCLPGACKTVLTPEAMEVLESLRSYLSAEDYGRFMALVKGEVGMPLEYSLAQNYPNPFNPATSIEYSVAGNARTTLRVYNVLGQELVTLVDEVKGPGHYSVDWDASEMASGVYFYRLEAGDFSATKRMVLMK
ncbi:MAG: T9SS type A sorting domain-containing protein [Gemmatimonadota bacterium]|nr:MAG: T9SS type A sorting domain-containing protein [Gemmatimonadota bacterium]